ncbi:protein kinase domain-containing protein [Streptomyces mesophilus]|uniref:protein kinase domain-containing protein n=1 Tax=Streptomyces mesophilus TaxID=1775132 RepID=UPI00331B6775
MTESPYAVPVPKGFRVGSWEVLEPLADGAFGSVYAARRTAAAPEALRTSADSAAPGADGELPAVAALKFLPTGTHTPHRFNHLRELAERETELLSRLRAPRIIRLYETLTADAPGRPGLDGATVLVLEKAETSLAALLRRSPAPAAGPALLVQVCEGLDQLHSAGWVHGDLKPANVLLMKDGSVRLADFGLAAELEGAAAYSPGFSTPDHAPPELHWAELGERGQQIRPSTDLWAFGVLAHLVLTGTHPLPGGTAEARGDALVRYARGTDDLRLSPELPDAWREIVTDCLARTHEERARHDASSLLRRAERAAGATSSSRLRSLRLLRGRPLLVAAAAVLGTAVALGSAVVYERGGEEVGYGYHHCPTRSVCFFSEENGEGQMCSWAASDPDWLAGPETCAWTRHAPVRSVYFNAGDPAGFHGVEYFRGPDFTPTGFDLERETLRTGCTAARAQGNLAGTYAPRSHRLVKRC